jgi:tRNA(Ile)-lysidine synthase TilS/MesJ
MGRYRNTLASHCLVVATQWHCLDLLADWAKNGCKVTAITVDHGLRAVSADEAVFAQVVAERLGEFHVTGRAHHRARQPTG